MATLVQAAQRAMDLYYQDYVPNDKFLDLDDFKYHIATLYSKMLNDMYQVERRANKQMEGFSNTEIPAAWMVEEVLVIDKENSEGDLIAETAHPVFAFDWDSSANALQGVHRAGNGPHCVYRKISLNERRFRGIIPPVSKILFYLNKPQEIVFWGARKGATIKVQYVPAVVEEENDCILSDNIMSTVIVQVLDLFFKSKNGNFVQELDDQNRTLLPQQQANPTIPK